MTQSPVSPSKFHVVIRELAKVRTLGGFAALTSGLLFLSFFFSLLLVTGVDRLIISLSVLACWFGFAVLAFLNRRLKKGMEDDEPVDDATP